jgi:hypothetical protein
MDGFKNTTKTKYMTEGGTYNERGRRATMSEIAAEDRRMAGRPSEGVSSRPTTASGRRASNADLGMTNSAKKPVGPSSVAVSKVLAGMTKPVKKALGGGVDAKLSRGITKVKADNTAPPQFEGVKFIPGKNGSSGGLSQEYMDWRQKQEEAAYQARMVASAKAKKATEVRPSSGNPLMGGNRKPNDIVASKPGSPTMIKKPRASMGDMLTMIKGAVKPSSGNLLTPPTTIKKPKPELPTREKPTYRDDPPMPPMPTRGPSMSPAFNDRPMIRRKTGGLAVMPGGKC